MRRLALLVLPLALGGCAAGTLLSYRISPDYPAEETGSLALAGLQQPVRIFYDALGVPHLEAQNELDLLRAVGFSQGRDRFFEMDMMRRFAGGRVAELVGEQPLMSGTTVDFDRSMRGWELAERAGSIVAKLSAADRERLEAYCAGVNAALERHPPLEHRLLGVEPLPWRAEDSWAVGLLNAWSVSHNWQQETARFLLALSVGLERAEAIYPAEPLGGIRTLEGDGQARELHPSIPPEVREYLAALPPAQLSAATGAEGGFGLLALAGASNAWVVSGARSKSGKPVLTNDPHLSHFLPSIVYQQHLKAPGLDVIGITIPGLPWVVMGHNDKVAWGLTATVGDVMDLVIERPDPARPGFVLHQGGDCPLTSREVLLEVKDSQARKLTLRRTCNGPVLNDLLPSLFPPGAPLLAVRWQLEGVEQSIEGLARVNKAGSVEQLRAEAAAVASPIQTFTAADAEGHIATFVSGAVPIRRAHRGTFPVPGWLSKYEWDGVVGHQQMPGGFDPPAGFFAHANNLMVDPRGTENPVNVDAAPPYRVERITERIKATERHDLDSLSDIQRDVKLGRAARVLPRILEDLGGLTPANDAEREAIELLRGWDYQASAGSAAAALFWAIYRNGVLDAVGDELSRPARDFFMSQRYSTNVADSWFERADHPVWDRRATPERETRTTLVRAAFAKAMEELGRACGGRPATWRWGTLHFAEPKHAFGGKSALAGLVNLERSEAGGALDSVWKSHFEMGDEKNPFRNMAGPVFRMVVDLSDLAHGRWVVDTGSSGWPGSPHYGDQYLLWRKGELAPMPFDWEEVRRDAKAVVTLTP